MKRLTALFERKRTQDRAALLGYFTAGDPGPKQSLSLLQAAASAGIDALELGFPFSDPVLDGPMIQRAHHRAIEAGASLAGTLEIVARFRDGGGVLPIVLMGYYNPVFAYGAERFAQQAASAGVDAVIVADLPVHEAAEELLPALAGNGLTMIPLYVPQLDPGDFASRRAGLGGFLYCIPVAGPTGGPAAPAATVERAVARCRTYTDLPISVGFGIKSPAAAAAVARMADGVIVGSALVAHVQRWVSSGGRNGSALYDGVTAFVSELRHAVEAARGPNAT